MTTAHDLAPAGDQQTPDAPDGRVRDRRRRAPRRAARDTAAPGRRAMLLDAAMHAALAVVSTIAALGFLGMFSRPFGVPLVYSGDALSGGSQVKGTLENGWYENNPALGAPFGQDLHDFPLADNMQFVLARFFGSFTDQWAVAYNLTYLVTYPLTAMAAAWFLRVLGCRRLTAAGFGLLFAFTPYHFIHGQPHLALSMLFVVPLWAAVVLRVLDDRPVWGRRGAGAWWSPLAWATPLTVGTLLVLVVVGSTSSYYAVFGLLLMAVAVVVLLLRRRVRAAMAGAGAMAGLIVVMLANMAPDILYARGLPVSPAAFARQPLESEIYALKFASLVFPAPWHRIDALSQFRLNYDGTFPQPAESPTLGLVSTVGFLFLLLLPFALMLAGRSGPLPAWLRHQPHLALLAVSAFFLGTIGGLGTLFALFVSADIRAWNRIVVYIALFGLASVALLADQALRRLRRRLRGRPPVVARGATAGALAIVVTLGLLDQAAPPGWGSTGEEVSQWRNDEQYVAAVEATVPHGTEVFELPVMAFPESLPVNEVRDYEPLRPYLHSSSLRWSYGGLKGRPRADWQQVVQTQPPVRMLVALAASGFGGLHLDHNGYTAAELTRLEDTLDDLLPPPVESPDGRFAFYDLTGLRDQVTSDYTDDELASIRRHTLRAPIFYWQPGFAPPSPQPDGTVLLAGTSAAPTAVVDNPAGAIPMKLSFTVRANQADYPATVDITWPDGVRQSVEVRDDAGTPVSRRLVVARGQSTMSVATIGAVSLNLVDLVLRDPALAFELRGDAADVAAARRDQGGR